MLNPGSVRTELNDTQLVSENWLVWGKKKTLYVWSQKCFVSLVKMKYKCAYTVIGEVAMGG